MFVPSCIGKYTMTVNFPSFLQHVSIFFRLQYFNYLLIITKKAGNRKKIPAPDNIFISVRRVDLKVLELIFYYL